jgi:outer membrane protein OmpA-like peptidoglycan-associated protein
MVAENEKKERVIQEQRAREASLVADNERQNGLLQQQQAQLERQKTEYANLRIKFEMGLGDESRKRRTLLMSDYLSGDAEDQEEAVLKIVSLTISEVLTVDFDKSGLNLGPEENWLVENFERYLVQRNLKVTIEGHAGTFCTVSTKDGIKLAPDDLLIQRCRSGTHSYLLNLSGRMAIALRDKLVRFGATSEHIFTSGFGDTKPLYEYPQGGTAGNWNRIAKLNNRLEIRAR